MERFELLLNLLQEEKKIKETGKQNPCCNLVGKC